MAGIHLFEHSTDAVSVPPGEVLFREGEPGQVMFAVIDGLIELSQGGRLLAEVGRGGIVGELALIDAAPRSATAAVRLQATVVPIDRDRFTFLVQEHPTFALQVMSVMADRLRDLR